MERAKEIVEEFRDGKKPTPGPQNGRKSCEPAGAQTTLLEDDTWDPKVKMRADF